MEIKTTRRAFLKKGTVAGATSIAGFGMLPDFLYGMSRKKQTGKNGAASPICQV